MSFFAFSLPLLSSPIFMVPFTKQQHWWILHLRVCILSRDRPLRSLSIISKKNNLIITFIQKKKAEISKEMYWCTKHSQRDWDPTKRGPDPTQNRKQSHKRNLIREYTDWNENYSTMSRATSLRKGLTHKRNLRTKAHDATKNLALHKTCTWEELPSKHLAFFSFQRDQITAKKVRDHIILLLPGTTPHLNAKKSISKHFVLRVGWKPHELQLAIYHIGGSDDPVTSVVLGWYKRDHCLL